MELRKGDILAVHGDGWISREIEEVTHSTISHVALVVDDQGTALEAQGFTVVRLLPASTYAGHCQVLRCEALTNADAVIAYAKAQLGKPYNYLELLEELIRYETGEDVIRWDASSFICSTLLAAAYQAGGIALTDAKLPSPADIYKSNKLTNLGAYTNG